jgi:alkaline phosphatase
MRSRGSDWLAGLALIVLASCAAQSDRPRSAPDSRNVILFLGDGMGISTVTAARILAGQLQGHPGEEHALSFESFPNVALIKTYNTDSQVADSAGTMAAIMTGQKTRIGFINVSANVSRNDCAGALQNEVPSLLQMAADAGLATGIVSTARITHATPAATYAHVPNRNWESDAQLPPAAVEQGCRDIARQMIEFDRDNGIDVMLGGGRSLFFPEGVPDPEYPELAGMRRDGRNLVAEWLDGGAERHYVWRTEDFEALPADRGQVLGLFEPSHMQFEADRAADPAGEPSIEAMTRFAIQRLQAAGTGFFLMVEGGRIDHAHHAGNAYRALTDTIAMADAVAAAVELTDPRETLIVVTADHSHTLTLSGYPRRGNPILGKVETPLGELGRDSAGRPYTTLSYANGPGFREVLPDLTTVDTTERDFLQVATVPMSMETHGGEDVAAYAIGVNAEALRGVMEQNRIFDVLRDGLFPGRR